MERRDIEVGCSYRRGDKVRTVTGMSNVDGPEAVVYYEPTPRQSGMRQGEVQWCKLDWFHRWAQEEVSIDDQRPVRRDGEAS